MGLEVPQTLSGDLRDPGQCVGPPLDLGDFFFPLASGLEFSVGIFCRDSNLGIPFSDIFLQGFKPRRPIAQHFIWQDGRGRPAPRLRRGLRRGLLHELRHGLRHGRPAPRVKVLGDFLGVNEVPSWVGRRASPCGETGKGRCMDWGQMTRLTSITVAWKVRRLKPSKHV